jgi:hypothetical protein
MASGLADEIDVLVKARRSLAGDYVPSDAEEYMNAEQQDYFRRLLQQWKKLILSAAADTLSQLQEGRCASLISTIVRRRKRIGASNCAPAIASAN